MIFRVRYCNTNDFSGKEKKDFFIQIKSIWYYNVYIHKLKLNKLFRLKYNSDTSCRKGEYVHTANFWYKIESTLIIRCTHSGYSIDVCCLFSLALIAGTSPQKSISARREQVQFSMAIGNGELMHECFHKHPRMGTAR